MCDYIVHLQVAVGTEAGHITTCDMSTRQLSPVQRFFVDHGPITALAAMVTFEQRGGVAASSAPRSQDGAGVVAGPMGLPWRLFPHAIGAQPEGASGCCCSTGQRVLSTWHLAVASTARLALTFSSMLMLSGNYCGNMHTKVVA
jgi:hypothetical protein